MIAHLVENGRPHGIGVAYVYCNYDDQINQTPAKLIGSLVKQLAGQLPNIPEFFNAFSNARRMDPPTTDDCLDALKQLSSMFTRTFLVIDALDEEENSPQKHRAELIAACKEITQIGSSTRLLVTSRPYLNDISNAFTDAIRLDIAASEEDLQA
jgi:ankyrin repeat domain-containing protein 50